MLAAPTVIPMHLRLLFLAILCATTGACASDVDDDEVVDEDEYEDEEDEEDDETGRSSAGGARERQLPHPDPVSLRSCDQPLGQGAVLD